MFTKKLM